MKLAMRRPRKRARNTPMTTRKTERRKARRKREERGGRRQRDVGGRRDVCIGIGKERERAKAKAAREGVEGEDKQRNRGLSNKGLSHNARGPPFGRNIHSTSVRIGVPSRATSRSTGRTRRDCT